MGGEQLPAGRPEDVARSVLARTGLQAAVNTTIYQLRDRNINASTSLSSDFTFMVRANGPVPVYDDLTAVYSAERMRPGTEYAIESLVTNASQESLRNAGTDYPAWVRERYLQVPPTMPKRVREKAQELAAAVGATTPYDTAVAIEAFLRTYKYETQIALPPAGRDYVDYFLFDSKEGYCEYYSSAMVMMLRSMGIPAREAAGYAPGEYDPTTGEWTVRESSAHAWPEVYFPGAGWVEFEPTPAQSVITRPETEASALASPTPYVPLTPAAPPTRINRAEEETPTPVGGGANANTPQGAGGVGWGGVIFLIGLLSLAGVVVGRSWIERQAVASGRLVLGGTQYYERLIKLAWWIGLRPRSSDTPYEFAKQLSKEVPGAGAQVTSIVGAYVRERFGQHQPDRVEQQELAQAWAALRNRLLRRLSEARRWLERR
jgi:transglutaminase-like putative cysteine protease